MGFFGRERLKFLNSLRDKYGVSRGERAGSIKAGYERGGRHLSGNGRVEPEGPAALASGVGDDPADLGNRSVAWTITSIGHRIIVVIVIGLTHVDRAGAVVRRRRLDQGQGGGLIGGVVFHVTSRVPVHGCRMLLVLGRGLLLVLGLDLQTQG